MLLGKDLIQNPLKSVERLLLTSVGLESNFKSIPEFEWKILTSDLDLN